jgi:hypothetical protein
MLSGDNYFGENKPSQEKEVAIVPRWSVAILCRVILINNVPFELETINNTE